MVLEPWKLISVILEVLQRKYYEALLRPEVTTWNKLLTPDGAKK